MVSYKDEKNILRQKLQDVGSEINLAFSKLFFQRFTEWTDFDFNFLSQPPNETTISLLAKGGEVVSTKKYCQDKDKLIFKVSFDYGTTLTKHFHSDANELIHIVEGDFYIINEYPDGKTEDFILKKGEQINIKAGVVHQVTSLTIGDLYIIFNKV